MADVLSITSCVLQTHEGLILGLLPFISFFFIIIGFVLRIGFVGFLGSILMLVTTLVISPCLNIFAFVLALISIVLIIYFVTEGFSLGNNRQ